MARFTGLAGELPATVKQRNADGTVLVEHDGGIPFLARSRPAAAAQTVTVLIRPTGVHLCPPSGTAAGDNGAGHNGHHLTGRVTDVAFRGRGYEHAIDIDGRIRLTGVLAETRVPRGEQVGLRLDVTACHAFPNDTTNTA